MEHTHTHVINGKVVEHTHDADGTGAEGTYIHAGDAAEAHMHENPDGTVTYHIHASGKAHLYSDGSGLAHAAGEAHVHSGGTVHTHAHGHGHYHHHENTKAVLNRLSRAIGHLESIKRMVEDGRDCSEVLIQLSAVKSAINNTGKVILEDHIKHCLVEAIESGDMETIEELNRAIDRFIK